jgi:ribosomal protein S18 acetylase RimI-like enzyme
VEPALLAAGFRPERRLPVMTCPPDGVTTPPEPRDVDLRLAVTDPDLLQVAEAQNDAYGAPAATGHDVARLRRTIERGGLVALAVDGPTGHGVGGGLCAPPHDGVSELAGVGVRASHRCRGVAAALTALLTRSCADHGIDTPFLTPASGAEERIYRSVGYRSVGEMLHISR